MNRPDLIDHLEGLKKELERINDNPLCEKQFALVHAVRALREVLDGPGNTPSGRQRVRSVYRMCAAAAGMDHD